MHPNTVRYRLRQVAELTGLTPGQPRDAFTLQIALVLGRQSGRAAEPTAESAFLRRDRESALLPISNADSPG